MPEIKIEQVSELTAVALWLNARYGRPDEPLDRWRADATELLRLLDIDPTGQRFLNFAKVTSPSLEALGRGALAELERRRPTRL